MLRVVGTAYCVPRRRTLYASRSGGERRRPRRRPRVGGSPVVAATAETTVLRSGEPATG